MYPLVEAYAIDDFIGVSTDGQVEEGLYQVQSTGQSIQPVIDAASVFLASLTLLQRKRTLFPVDDSE